MGKLIAAIPIAVGLALVALALAAGASQRTVEKPHLASMAESAQALEQAGVIMQARGTALRDEGQRRGDKDLVGHGEHWLRDGEAMVQRGRWLSMAPAAPGSLRLPTADLVAQGSWGELLHTVQAMVQDPTRAQSVDLGALRWGGRAMAAEGQNMVEHGRVMAEEAALIATRFGLGDETIGDLARAARSVQEVGSDLAENGQAMADYAERLRRSLAAR